MTCWSLGIILILGLSLSALSPNNPNTLHDYGSEERGERERERIEKKLTEFGFGNNVFLIFFFYLISYFSIILGLEFMQILDFVASVTAMMKTPSSLFSRERAVKDEARICL